ncbi:MAG: 3-dehydroquinate synthase [Saprospiraceae bacterium]|nr:3-dehydroquinate synthase [Saprospiraceae bacterium]
MIPNFILFENADFTGLKNILNTEKYSKIWVLVDENTAQYCLPILQDSLSPEFTLNIIQIPSGEAYKNLGICQNIWQKLLNEKTNRKAILLNLGGGVIGDMGGFCAATYKRGIDFIQIPTTLLAQVDASVGGKLGVDFQGLKNMIGLFQAPKAVCIYTPFFKTLPYEELRSGWAEVIKHALIMNADYWQALQVDHLDQITNWDSIVRDSIAIKSQIVAQDPKEKNLRKSLNFGHTIGHAIESVSLETSQPLKHGEAVAFGLLMECFLAHQQNKLDQQSLSIIQDYILNIYDYYSIENMDRKQLIQLMLQDKKNENDLINFTFINKIGQFEINQSATVHQINQALDYYQSLVPTI